MSELTPQQEREYVESRWRNIEIESFVWAEQHHHPMSWHEAYLFTLERQRKIAELESDLVYVRVTGDGGEGVNGKHICSLLQHELEQLKRGMTAGG